MKTIILLAALLLTAPPAFANMPIKLGGSEAYSHPDAQVAVPVILDGIARSGAEDFAAQPGLDVSLQYVVPGRTEVTSVFVFRQVLGNGDIWFDRAQMSLLANRMLGAPMPAQTETFAAPGANVPNGLRSIHSFPAGGRFRSTAVALIPLNGWMVSLRLTSATLDEAQMRNRLERTIAAIQWPSFAEAKAAKVVNACATPLIIRKAAKQVSDDSMAAALFGGVLAGLDGKNGDEMAKVKKMEAANLSAPPWHWCRDSVLKNGAGVYRTEDASDNYIIAMGDSGSGFAVGKSLAGLMSNKKRWSARLILLDRQHVFQDYDGLPQPEQVVALLETGKPISSAVTWPKTGAITISPRKP